MDGSIEKSSITKSKKTAKSVLSDAGLSPDNMEFVDKKWV